MPAPAAIPANLLGLASSIAKLAAMNPKAAELVITVMTKSVDRAIRMGPLDPDVWARSFQAAARQFANRKFADEWTRGVVTRGRSLIGRFAKDKSDADKAR